MAVTLLGINHDGPVEVKDWTGSVYPPGTVFGVFEPKEFDKLVAFINRNGGPSFWTVDPIEQA